MFHFASRLHEAVRTKRTPALVGIDPRFDQLPPSIIDNAESSGGSAFEVRAQAFEEFGKRLIDVVAPLVPAVKPQAAFFEELGPHGCVALDRVMRHARKEGLIVICDAKRGDIGSTAEAYARAYLAGADPDSAAWSADALTVNPYLGTDTLQPFVDVAKERGAGIYVLARTSNPGAGTFQDIQDAGGKVYEHVADAVEALAVDCADGDYGCIGAVVGATYPQELAELRGRMPHVPLLIPGYGTQGGGASDVAASFRDDGLGALINSSRGINFAYNRQPYKDQFEPENWEAAVEAATKDMVEDLAKTTPAASLR